MFYSFAIDSAELFSALTAVIFLLMAPLAYLVYKRQVVNG